MKYGLYLPNFGPFGDARLLAELARDAECAGWDGFFLWDHIDRPGAPPVVDPWIALAAIASATERIRIGALVTPLARRRPWKVARETVSLDRLSNGRLIFGAGLGSSSGAEVEWAAFGEETGLVRRARILDEGLEILCGLWRGEPFYFDGLELRVRGAQFRPTPLQSPRIPVWIGAYWRIYRRCDDRALGRTLRALPRRPPRDVEQLAEAVAYVRALRTSAADFEVVYCSDHETAVAPYARAGATWWLRHLKPDSFGASWTEPWPLERMRARVASGPPRA
jgi:alkanesulfonate monooxygenase SsuD/methylene tetrahydromethanopterin reductase-like flavin-dependent oxidoreductase (luciferase family)